MIRKVMGTLMAAQLLMVVVCYAAPASEQAERGGWLGVRMASRAMLSRALQQEQIPDYLLAVPNLEQLVESWDGRGVAVIDVLPETPAERAGLFPGDVVIELNGIRVDSAGTLAFLMRKAVPDREATVTLLRDGERRELYFIVGTRKDPSEEKAEKEEESAEGP